MSVVNLKITNLIEWFQVLQKIFERFQDKDDQKMDSDSTNVDDEDLINLLYAEVGSAP